MPTYSSNQLIPRTTSRFKDQPGPQLRQTRSKRAWIWPAAFCLAFALPVCGQDASNSAPSTASPALASPVPRLVNFSGVLKDKSGKPVTGEVSLTLALYADQEGGPALWFETQTVQLDEQGRYSLLLGSTRPDGLPLDLFTRGEAQWLGVQPTLPGATELPRVLLVGMPYALKAADADTLGGKPASAFLTAESHPEAPASTSGAILNNGATSVTGAVRRTDSSTPVTSLPPAVHGSGTNNFFPLWTGASTIGISAVFQSGGNVGVGTTTPAATLDVNGSVKAAGPVSGASGSFTTNVSGSQLTSTVATGTAPLVVSSTTQVANLNASLLGGTPPAGFATTGANSFTGNQSVTGNVSATGPVSGSQFLSTVATGTPPLAVSSTTQVPNLNASFVGGVAAGNFATLGPNSFTGNQTIAGNLTASTSGATTIEGDSISGAGVAGTSSSADGVVGIGGGNGVFGTSNGSGIGAVAGVFGQGNAFNGNGVIGSSTGLGGVGVYGTSDNSSVPSGSVGVFGTSGGGEAVVGSGDQGDGILGNGGDGENGMGYSGNFQGSLNVSLAIIAGVKDFRIDHPLDPANRYLYHSSVESSEMKNIYDGIVTLDATGGAVVELPAWFQALNRDFRYQLTAVGSPAPGLYIAEEISGNRFKIAGGSAGLKVSWLVTGVRQDAFAKAHPLRVEVDKSEKERGYYIHPDLYGAPEEKGIEWARHPQVMQRIKATKANATSQSPKP